MSNPESTEAFGANSWLIDEMRERWEQDPASVDASWQRFFSKGNAAAAEKPTPAPAPAPEQKPTPPPAPRERAPRAESSQPVVESRLAATTETPASPGTGAGLSANAPNPSVREEAAAAEPKLTVLRGAPMRTAKNMDASLTVPTATSVRSVPMKLVIDQRILVNNFLTTSKGGKVSFTHIIAYAMVKALKTVPAMNNAYDVVDGKPTLIENPSINLGIAIDLKKSDGTRQLLVPNIKGCERLNFAQFWSDYEKVVARARKGELTVADFAGTTATITNPGGIGTNHSVPRLMNGQGMILGVGNIDYPAEFQGTSISRITDLGISKITTLTSTYDHRVIQGAQSGEFLKVMHELLLGADGFYDEIFEALRIPYEPLRWSQDVSAHRASQVSKQGRVLELINAYRSVGHLVADTDPLEYRQRSHEDLRLETHGLSIWDLDREFAVGTFGAQKRSYLTLRDILQILQNSYCRTVAFEYMHIADPRQREWFQERIEVPRQSLTHEEHMHALDKLNEAEVFETFLQTKFVGQKRFSLEGGESVIVLLDEVCQQAATAGLDEVCIGMPHRGRLNVLTNIVGKHYGQIFREFDGTIDVSGTGDVKYHLGAEGQFVANNGSTIKTSVAANPSHLEAVNPVLEGIARAKQDMLGGDDHPVLPMLLHGDASFSGQGVVFETLQMSQLRAYRTGGTIHVVVNNQVGFTTAPVESRTSTYCTDVAKAIAAPVLHVNGDDPDSCIRAARIAFAYREKFHKDVVIDLICYRRRGHNEGDDPSFTQPKMYDLIEQKRSVRRLYTEALIGRGDISVADAENVMNAFRNRLENVFKEVREAKTSGSSIPEEYTRVPYYPTKPERRLTEITPEMMKRISEVHTQLPEGFTPHPKVMPQLERRAEQILNGPIDWATAELLAIGSLLMEGRPVRLTGQDSRRGTFSQRFAAIVDRVTNEAWVPLKHLSEDQGTFDVYDSLLSEYAVLGFEYGYSVARPDALVMWEAQFGDFANGAQTIADEFVASGEAKWSQKSGVVLLLPHGFEGQGPDHSSARLERWLQLCAENALAVCQPSTAASHFHLLRQHAYVNWHRPVVIATPKSMLRSKAASSMPEDFTSGRWEPVHDDPSIQDPAKVTKLLVCSGKIRWELVARREQLGLDGSVAVVALERLYPLPGPEMAKVLERYRHVTDIRFVQDEPANQGPWPFISVHLPNAVAQHSDLRLSMRRVARPWSSAPSVGSLKVHQQQTEELLKAAFED